MKQSDLDAFFDYAKNELVRLEDALEFRASRFDMSLEECCCSFMQSKRESPGDHATQAKFWLGVAVTCLYGIEGSIEKRSLKGLLGSFRAVSGALAYSDCFRDAERSIPAEVLAEYEALARSNLGKAGVKAKLDNDPKQKEKDFVYKCWQEWQTNPDSYRSKAAFARDMLDKVENLSSQKKIEDWCREWEKSALSQHSEH